MGAASGTLDPSAATSSQVGRLVEGLGLCYHEYGPLFETNGISGHYMIDKNSVELATMCRQLKGDMTDLHVDVIVAALVKYRSDYNRK